MAQFHETGYGRRFFEHELPELNRNLKRIADALENRSEVNTEILNLTSQILEKTKEQPAVTIADSNFQDNLSLLRSVKIKDVFSIRISNALLYCKYPKHNLLQLVTSKERELLSTKNFGAKCLTEVNEYLSKVGLELDMTEEEIQQKVLPIPFHWSL